MTRGERWCAEHLMGMAINVKVTMWHAAARTAMDKRLYRDHIFDKETLVMRTMVTVQ